LAVSPSSPFPSQPYIVWSVVITEFRYLQDVMLSGTLSLANFLPQLREVLCVWNQI